jgi:hypothetical protein
MTVRADGRGRSVRARCSMPLGQRNRWRESSSMRLLYVATRASVYLVRRD